MVGLGAHSHHGSSWPSLHLILNGKTEKALSQKKTIADNLKIIFIIKPSCTFDFQECTPWCFTAGAGSHTRVNPRVWQLVYDRIHMYMNIWIKHWHTNSIDTQNVITPLITLLVEEPFHFPHPKSSSNNWMHVLFLLLKYLKVMGRLHEPALCWPNCVLFVSALKCWR